MKKILFFVLICSTAAQAQLMGGYMTSPEMTVVPPKCGGRTSNGVFREWMCTNLGGTIGPGTTFNKGTNGDYYQWGQKNPACDVDGNITGTNPITGAIYQGFKPATAITAADWSDTNYDSTTEPGKKCQNDPCPLNFRLPTRAEVESFVSSVSGSSNAGSGNTGIIGSSVTIFTAGKSYRVNNMVMMYLQSSGVIDATQPVTISERGATGSYWTSSQGNDPGRAFVMLFYNNGAISSVIAPIGTNPSAQSLWQNGRTIRCVRVDD